MAWPRERVLVALLFVNLWLQIFDGLATYVGLSAGYGEANPLVAAALPTLGAAPTLVLFKVYACACLIFIWQFRRRSVLALPALLATAVAYCAWSLGPWSVALAAL